MRGRDPAARPERRALIDPPAAAVMISMASAVLHVRDDLDELPRADAPHAHVVLLARRDDGIESTLAGWQSTLFSLTSDALATCAIMKPECSPLSGGEERREPGGERRVHELLDATLADVRELGDGDRGEIERERERLAVEVAAADDVGPAVARRGRRSGCR